MRKEEDRIRAERMVVPGIEEEVDVSKRAVRHGVRIRRATTQRDEVIEAPLRREDVSVERVPVNREVEGPLAVREENGQIVIPVVEETVVVRKAWVLREEIRISKRVQEEVHRERVTLRREDVQVERLEGEPRPSNVRKQTDGHSPTEQGE